MLRKGEALFFAILIMCGCSGQERISENQKVAEVYLEGLGYEVLAFNGESLQQFTYSNVHALPNQQIWAVQEVEPEAYLNKEIARLSFLIKNHPLDSEFDVGKTDVTVFVYDGEVIGGFSYPLSKKKDVIGAPYSLTGKTAEEMQVDYSTWLKEWDEKYKSAGK